MLDLVLSRWPREELPQDAAPPKIDARLDRVPDAVVVCVRGEVDMASSPELEVNIRLAITSGRPLIVDLAECAFIDCSALSVLIRAHRWLNGSLRVVVPPDKPIRKLLSLSGLVEALGVVAAL
jgi:anti-anti-sigma factor